MSAPRVLLVSSHAKPGGAERVLLDVVAGLPAESVVEVVTLEDGPLVETLRRRGVPVSVLPTSARKSAVVLAALRLRRRLRAGRPDVVHANGVKAALVCVAATQRVPVVWMKHDVSFDGRLGRLIAARCAKVAAVSQEVLRGIGDAGSSCIVHPGVEVDEGAARSASAGLRRDLDVPPGARVVSVLGRLDPSKGHAELVEALPAVAAAVPSVVALLVGSDDPARPGHRDALRALAAQRDVTGRVRVAEHLDGQAVLALSDAVVVATVPHPDGQGREGFGLVAAEAMALGVPVVGYDVGATAEVLAGCGALVAPGDRAALAAALVGLLTDDEEHARVARRGRERARELTVEGMVARLVAVYREVSG